MRVGVLHGGLEQESEKAIPPSQKLRILRASEIKAISAASGNVPLSSTTSVGYVNAGAASSESS